MATPSSYYEKDTSGKAKSVTIEIPFEVPGTWQWARLLNLYILNPKNVLPDDADVSFLPMALIEEGLTGRIHPEIRKWSDVKKGFTQFANGDIVFAKISPCFENGKYFIARNLSSGAGAGTTELYVLRPYTEGLLPEYIFLFLASNHFVDGATKKFKGTVGQQRVKKEYIEEAIVPIPPLEEQRRITEAYKELVDFFNLF